MRIRRLAPVLLVPVLAASALLAAAAPSSAAAGDVIVSFDSAVDVRTDSTFHVRETIAYRFAGTDRHGIFRTIPVEYDLPDDRDHVRVVAITNVAVSSPSGASASVQKGVEDGQLVLKIGDADETVRFTETYVIDYDVSGAMNEFDEHDEFYWNVTGLGWDAPIERAAATVTGPVPPSSIVCFQGAGGATLPCSTNAVDGNTATFGATGLDSNEGMTVAVAYPPAAIDVAAPVLKERWSIHRAFSVDPLPLGLAVLTLLGGLAAVAYVVWSRGRDRTYVGQIPGLTPVGDQDGPEARKPLFGNPAVAVDFAPPKNMRPGEAGTLMDESADVLDVTATIIDLAVRGYLRIDEVGQQQRLFTKRDWKLTQLKPSDDMLKRYEQTLLDALFKDRNEVTLRDLRQTFASDLEAVQKQLYSQVVEERWFRRRPDSTRAAYGFVGILLVALGGALTYVLARWTQFGLVGLAAVFAGIAMLVAGQYMPARTGRGSAAHTQLLGFRQYIRTAEANQIRFEEREQVFSRYLPYAIVFGETDHWSKTFASLAAGTAAGVGGAATAHGLNSLYWYGAMGGGGIGDLNDSLSSFASSTAGSIAAAAPSGGSGFGGGGGGFSGGGFGGGGGGSW
jgi:uncharacterized membrane protein